MKRVRMALALIAIMTIVAAGALREAPAGEAAAGGAFERPGLWEWLLTVGLGLLGAVAIRWACLAVARLQNRREAPPVEAAASANDAGIERPDESALPETEEAVLSKV